MLPHRYAPWLFALVLSGLMSLFVSGVATLRTAGLGEHFLVLWRGAWLAAWPVAFPLALVVAPVARRLVDALVAKPQ